MSNQMNTGATQVLEDKIHKHLDGELKQTALCFVDYLKENQLTPQPDIYEANAVKIPYDGKNLCKIWFHPGEIHIHFWFGDYSGEFDEAFKEAVQAGVGFCNVCHQGCTGPFDVPIFGKALKNVCSQHTVAFTNPDSQALEHVKTMLEYSKQIVPDSVSVHANH